MAWREAAYDMACEKALSESLEDYLEAIFHIESDKQAARATDISRRLGVKNSSVTGALRALAERELVNYAPYDLITLTPKGRRMAADVVKRHEVLLDFFTKVLGIDEDEAQECACRMEHAMPKSLASRFTQFLSFVEHCPRGGEDWLAAFARQCEQGADLEDCERCVSQCMAKVGAAEKTSG